MEELETKINENIKTRLSEHRYMHSIGVMEKAGELAEYYGLDINKARVIGLAHDIAKQMSKEETKEYVEEYGIELDQIEVLNTSLIHAKIGADICKREYDFDEQMVNAVKYHTTGNPKMDLMAKIIFMADKIEENRHYIGIERRRELTLKDIDMAIIETIDYTTQYCIEKNELIHPDSINTRNYLLKIKKENKINN